MTDKYFAAQGPLATDVMECHRPYFTEGILSRTGAIGVRLHNGEVHHITGTRYLYTEAGARIRAEDIDGTLEVIYLGEVLVSYAPGEWADWTDLQPTGGSE